MWCANCQDDVAAEISEDGQILKCTTCGESIRQVFAPSLHPETKSARDLLKKWAEEQQQVVGDQQLGDQVTNSETSPSEDVSEPDKAPVEAVRNEPGENQEEKKPVEDDKQRPVFRIDAAHDSPHRPTPEKSLPPFDDGEPVRENPLVNEVVEAANHETAAHDDVELSSTEAQPIPMFENRREHYSHSAHVQAPPPHFDVAAASQHAKTRPGRSEVIWGQLMAYAGVGVLTVGTVLVLWGYFGMVEQYASTGWLLSTAGQMLLLLGIVTLVSGGMQQTTHEVTERIEYLGGRMIRIEQSTDQLLKGPHIGKSRHRQQGSELSDEEQSTV